MNTLHVLCAEGDTRLSWDPRKPEEVAEARQAITALKSQGYGFFLLDGSPAPDEVDAGGGQLACRRIDAEALLAPLPHPAAATVSEAAPGPPATTDQEPIRTFERAGRGKKQCPACKRYVHGSRPRCACGHEFGSAPAAVPAAAPPAGEQRAVAVRPLRGG